MTFNFETGEFVMADLAGFTWPDAKVANVPSPGEPTLLLDTEPLLISRQVLPMA